MLWAHVDVSGPGNISGLQYIFVGMSEFAS